MGGKENKAPFLAGGGVNYPSSRTQEVLWKASPRGAQSGENAWVWQGTKSRFCVGRQCVMDSDSSLEALPSSHSSGGLAGPNEYTKTGSELGFNSVTVINCLSPKALHQVPSWSRDSCLWPLGMTNPTLIYHISHIKSAGRSSQFLRLTLFTSSNIHHNI